MSLSEEQFRGLLDAHGVLRAGALEPPEFGAAYAVFAQRADAMLDIAAIKNHAARFFGTKLGLTVDKQYGATVPLEDAARVVVASDDAEASGTRLCYGRPTSAVDHVAAETAERLQQTSGMSLLAQRCGMVWLVTRDKEDDRVSLTIAAILASTLLGPILAPEGDAIFGVRTARMKLEGRRAPYR